MPETARGTIVVLVAALGLVACTDTSSSVEDAGANGDTDGASCEVGTQKQKDCNVCECTQSGWTCTEAACDVSTSDADTTDGGSADGEAGAGSDTADGGDTVEDAVDANDTAGDDAVDVSGNFSCGGFECTRGEEYCLETYPGVRPPDGGTPDPSYECKAYGDCGSPPDCKCLEERHAIGGAGAQCSHEGPGEYRVVQHLP